jgi:carbonic anhydrase
MKQLKQLFDNNRRWVTQLTAKDPDFFQRLSHLQQPQYLWIGCADSRVPANEIVGLLPGELFVHRNISNVVAANDTNCLSVLQYAVDVLQVRHVIVCGHYGCGGIEATLEDRKLGLADQWLKNVRDVRTKHWDQLSGMEKKLQSRRLCELNVIEQVLHVTQTGIVRDAWERKQQISVHGWIYGVENGLLRDLGLCISHFHEVEEHYLAAVDGLAKTAG